MTRNLFSHSRGEGNRFGIGDVVPRGDKRCFSKLLRNLFSNNGYVMEEMIDIVL